MLDFAYAVPIGGRKQPEQMFSVAVAGYTDRTREPEGWSSEPWGSERKSRLGLTHTPKSLESKPLLQTDQTGPLLHRYRIQIRTVPVVVVQRNPIPFCVSHGLHCLLDNG